MTNRADTDTFDEFTARIRTWPAEDADGLMRFIEGTWADYGSMRKEEVPMTGQFEWYLATGGWSENEEIISAMQENYVWWAMNWLSSFRGGAYRFKTNGGGGGTMNRADTERKVRK